MAATAVAPREKRLFPPPETFWQRYSPRMELPISAGGSLLIHCLLLGLPLLVWLGILSFGGGAPGPVQMTAVVLEGSGDGPEGLGGEQGLPGARDATGTEIIQDLAKNQTDILPDFGPRSKDSDIPEIPVPPLIDPSAEVTDAVLDELAKIDNEVKRQMNLPTRPETPPQAKAEKKSITGSKGLPGTGNPKGTGGLGGTGGGPGRGNKSGPGTGTGGLGRSGTKQEILAARWRFDLTGNAKEHAKKLSAIGVTLALQDQRGGFFIVQDLNKRPAPIKADNLVKFKDAVKWYNAEPKSVSGLAQELGLPFVPKFVVLLLPKDREEQMAEEEARFAKEQGRGLPTVQATWFDFRVQGGDYQPRAIRLE